jgi:hypothetical protein
MDIKKRIGRGAERQHHHPLQLAVALERDRVTHLHRLLDGLHARGDVGAHRAAHAGLAACTHGQRCHEQLGEE